MDHRLGKRRLVGEPVRLRLKAGPTTTGIMRDISRRGMYVDTRAKIDTYTCLEVGFHTPSAIGAGFVWIPMCVVRQSPTGIGLVRYKDVDGGKADASIDLLLHGKALSPPPRRWGLNAETLAA